MLTLLFATFTAQTVSGYSVLTPPLQEKNLVHSRRAETHLIIKAAFMTEAKSLRVERVMNREGDTEPVGPVGTWEKEGAVYVHYVLQLKKGTNSYTINPGAQELSIRYQPIHPLLKMDPDDSKAHLFHRNKVSPASCSGCHTEKLPEDSGLDVQWLEKNADFSPVCYSCHRKMLSKSKWLHAPASFVACMTCHRRGEESDKITTPVGRVDRTCFSCHINKRKWTSSSNVHGPVVAGDCTVCHDSHGGDYPFLLWADAKTDLCMACHEDFIKIGRKDNKFRPHGIIEGSGCSACHSPHATDYAFNLYKPINELCVSCHVGLQGITEGHPVGKHPVSGVKDSRRDGRELACSGCHNPHGSNYDYILIGNMLGGHVCSKCHH